MRSSSELRPLLCVLLLSLATLSGCSASLPVPGDYPDLTLAATRSAAGELRAEAQSRVPEGVVGENTETEVSVSCLSTTEDPAGTIRSWRSTVEFSVADSAGDAAESTANAIVAAFLDEGWASKDVDTTPPSSVGGASARVVGHLLSRPTELVKLQVAIVSDGSDSSLQIQAQGPCVVTDGSDSDEVKRLEGRV